MTKKALANVNGKHVQTDFGPNIWNKIHYPNDQAVNMNPYHRMFSRKRRLMTCKKEKRKIWDESPYPKLSRGLPLNFWQDDRTFYVPKNMKWVWVSGNI